MARGALHGGRAGASAAAEFRRRSAGRWWRRPVSWVLGVGGLGSLLWLVGRGRVDGVAVAAAAAAGGALGLAARVRPERDPERWLRGAEGERATAGVLGTLPRRFVVGHDLALPGGRANLDHVVIGPRGVFVIDSKAYRSRVRVRRGRAWAGEWPVDTAPVARQAEQLECALGVPVTPVVVIHGSGLRRRGVVDGGVRVLPASRLIRAVARRRPAWPGRLSWPGWAGSRSGSGSGAGSGTGSGTGSGRLGRLGRLGRGEVRALAAKADQVLRPAGVGPAAARTSRSLRRN
jgi:nuclease-like protein